MKGSEKIAAAGRGNARDVPACRAFLLASLDRAGGHLATPGPPSDESVHELRKSLKRARGALRLLREVTGEGIYRAENTVLRDAGRFFRGVRDAASLIEAFESLVRRHPGRLREAALGGPRRILRANLLRARRNLFRNSVVIEPVRVHLKALRGRAASWPGGGTGVGTGLRRIYRRGRRALAQARDLGTPEALHEWRKQVKYLQNALHALFPEGRGGSAKLAARASMLADALGDDHDLVALQQELSSVAYAALDPRTRAVLFELMRRDRRRCQRSAFALGEKLYARKPRRLLARLGMEDGAAGTSRVRLALAA